MSVFFEWIQQLYDARPWFYQNLLLSLGSIAVLWILRQWVLFLGKKRGGDVRVRYLWRKTTNYTYYFLLIILLGIIWLEDVSNLVTYLGFVSAGIVIALSDPITNVAGWLFILWRRPFKVGDRIQIGENAGDVIDSRLFQFTMLEVGNWVDADQSTGRMIDVPNRKVFSDPIANYTKGFQFIWNEIPVLITFESDWRKGKTLLEQIAGHHSVQLTPKTEKRIRSAAKRYLIYYSNLTPIVYTKVVDHGVMLTIRYLSDPRKRRGTEEAIWEEILDLFAQEPTLDFAYPTQRLYYHPVEGPPELRPRPSQGDDSTPLQT